MGANAVLIGQELLQFGRAEALGGGRYRLSDLLRGQRGSEWAIGLHASGEPIVLLDPASLRLVAMDRAMLGAEIMARAHGIADNPANPPSAVMVAGGESLRPMSPCHVEVSTSGASHMLRWVARRSTLVGWPASGGDESGEARFEVWISRGSGTLVRATTAASLVLTIAEADALGTGPIRFEVVEQGLLPSRPSTVILNA